MVHTYDGISVSLEKREILPFVTTWMDLEDMLLSEVRQTEEDVHEEPKTGKLLAAENRRLRGEGKPGLFFRGYKVSVMQEECVLELCCTTWCL